MGPNCISIVFMQRTLDQISQSILTRFLARRRNVEYPYSLGARSPLLIHLQFHSPRLISDRSKSQFSSPPTTTLQIHPYRGLTVNWKLKLKLSTPCLWPMASFLSIPISIHLSIYTNLLPTSPHLAACLLGCFSFYLSSVYTI